MKTIAIGLLCLLFGVCAFLTGCALFAGEVQAVDEDGNPQFLDSQGRETDDAVDPSTGKPNQPIMEYREDGGVLATGAKLTKQFLPSPWGDIASGVLGLGATGLGIWAARENVKKREARRAGAELVRSIEAEPAAKKAMIANSEAHSPELKKLVKYATPKKSVVTQKA